MRRGVVTKAEVRNSHRDDYLGDLDGERADTARGAIDQNLLGASARKRPGADAEHLVARLEARDLAADRVNLAAHWVAGDGATGASSARVAPTCPAPESER